MDEMPTEPGPAPEEPATAPASSVTSRRMLMLGAVGASTVIAVRPALAQATASVLTCQIPVPDPGNAGKYIDRNGNVVNPGPLGPLGALFGGPYPPPSRPFTGEEVRAALTKRIPARHDLLFQRRLSEIYPEAERRSGWLYLLRIHPEPHGLSAWPIRAGARRGRRC